MVRQHFLPKLLGSKPLFCDDSRQPVEAQRDEDDSVFGGRAFEGDYRDSSQSVYPGGFNLRVRRHVWRH